MILFEIIKRSKFIKSVGIYGGLNLVRQIFPFILLPVMTRYLSPEDYGVLAIFSILISVFYVAISLNLDAAIGREYFDRDKTNFPVYVSSCLYMGTISTIIMIPFVFLFGTQLEAISSVPKEYFVFIIVIGFSRFIAQTLLITWQSAMRAMNYSIFQISQIGVELILTVIFIVVLQWGLEGRIFALLGGAVFFAVIALGIIYRQGLLKLKFDSTYASSALGYGIPLIPHVIGGMIISMSDRFLLINLSGPYDTGLYFIGFQVGNVISLLVWSFNQAWSPWLFDKLSRNESGIKNKIVAYTYLYFLGLILITSLLVLLSPLIFKYFLGPEYAQGVLVVPWVALGSAFLGMYYMVGCYITYTRRTAVLSAITFITGILNVVLSYYLIISNGIVGAAQGTVIAYLISFAMTWYLAAREYPMPWFSFFERKKAVS